MALMGGNKDGKADLKAQVKVNVNKRNRSNAGGTETSSFADDPLDPMLVIKKRARRRLIGAIALVVGAIVFVPMIFDSGKNPVVDDISIQIPAKNTPFEPGKPAANHAAPIAPAADLNAAAAAVDDRPIIAEPGPIAVPAPAVSEAVKPAEKSVEKSATPPQESKPVEKKPAAEPTKDDARAVALLEGKTEDVKEEKPASYALQIGAFSDTEKVKFLREKLAAGGFKPYTEIVKTPQGERTRLRIGPYPDRADADKAQERVKKLFVLDGTVVPLAQLAGSATGQ